MALELASKGELFDYIFQTGSLSEEIARFYFLQLLNALEYIHNKGISHCDIKLENILLDERFNLKLADFGFSSKKSTNTTFKGSGEYMAPEIYSEQGYHGHVVDLFAAGVLLFIMVTGNPPFIKATANDDLYKPIVANRIDLFWKIHLKKMSKQNIKLSSSLIELLSFLLAYDPIERASLAEIKELEWCKLPAATRSDITDEFTKRIQLIESANQQDLPLPKCDSIELSELLESSHVTRSLSDVAEEVKHELIEREIKMFDQESSKITKFFSTSDLTDLFN